MNRIKILPENVANKIAAGEVVERPSSVVKELIENSIDAGASRITIETQAGGVGLIRVADDGCGMSRDDALLALERHATSKIACVEDITAVQTLGFRGEALPSIASVCRFELVTKEKDAVSAVSIAVDGGRVQSIKETSHQGGTTVEVKDLFYNIPARRKFLKSHTAENSHIAQTIRLAALSTRTVGFRWVCDGEELIQVPPSASLQERISALFEQEIAHNIVAVTKSMGLLNVGGVTGRPVVTRANRNFQLFFVNGRPVQNRGLSFAIKEAYHSLVMTDRNPVSFLFIDLPASDVDVNVHPSKREVRFRQESLVREAVVAAIRDAVASVQDVPSVGGEVSRQDRVREAIAHYEASMKQDGQALEHAGERFASVPGRSGQKISWTEGSGPKEETTAQEEIPILSSAKSRRLNPVGQIHKLYLLLESEEGLVILDQHAAHERVLYDEVLSKIHGSQGVESQKLLLPVTIATDPAQTMLLEQCQEDLTRMGMEVREFGKNTFVVEAIPFFIKTSDIKTLIGDVLDELAQDEKTLAVAQAREEAVLLTLCRIAVRAQDSLSSREQQVLVERLMACKNPYHCPHGRPTMIKLTKDYLARQFKRV